MTPDRRPVSGRHRERRRTTGRRRVLAVLALAALATGFGPQLAAPGDRAPRPAADRPTSDPSPGTADDGAELPDNTGGGADEPSPPTASEPIAGEGGSSRDPGGRVTAREVPAAGDGEFRVAEPDPARRTGAEEGVAAEVAELTYTVEVEGGVPFATDPTAARVDRVLADPRGWEGVAGQSLRRTATGPDFRVLLASPATTDLLCAPLATNGEVSCRNGDLVVLNALRWAAGIPDYRGRLDRYRTYLVNHEVGHRLGYGHVECPAPGEPAPVMQQQTYGLDGCTRNVWPATG